MTTNPTSKIVPAILSGGVGSRLWPLSRALYPKQLQPLISDKSLLQETVLRVSGDQFDAPIIVCNDDHRFVVGEQLQALGVKPAAILLEPEGRNTAPAVAAAATWIEAASPGAILLVMASDHVIRNQDNLLDAIASGADAASQGHLVAIGITASAPETAYGYIKAGAPLEGVSNCMRIERFVEKPDLETATAFVASGDYLWNASLFMFKAEDYMAELERLAPDMAQSVGESVANSSDDLDFTRLEPKAFCAPEPNSIDYAVMEKTDKAVVVPADLGWNDVGAWNALWEISGKDENGNAVVGDAVIHDVSNSYIRGGEQLVAAVGVQDAVIVATDDAVLVADKNRAQDVKTLVEQLQNRGRAEHESHTKVYRPWGWYQSLEIGRNFQVKLIQLSSGAKISLQRHQKRAEHWVVVAGTATVTKGEDVFDLQVNESTFIPVGEKHRLENKQADRLQIIEVQTGTYLGEDDIERFDDNYGRD